MNEKDADKKKVERTLQLLMIEKLYWQSRDVEYHLVYKEDLNIVYADNIRRVVEYYDSNRVHDDISRIKHLIATKQITVDLEHELDYSILVSQYLG